AGDLGHDISRYLAGEPIEAKRDSHWYVLKKTARRYRIPLIVSGAFFLLIGVFAIATMMQAQHVARERDRAIAAESASDQHARRLAEALSQSNIERGRAMGWSGNGPLAEDLIWQEFLCPPGPARGAAHPARPFVATAASHAYWALWELYST